jgi:DNA-binding response OmpR family regulator
MKPVLLVADSDAELCELYTMFFSELGYEVDAAFDGLDCVDKLRRLGPAVLLLDRELHWGGADGVLAWLREQSPLPEVSVVLTTGVDHTPDHPDDMDPPVVTCLTKPFAPELLLETVHDAFCERLQEGPFVLVHAAAAGTGVIE